MFDIKSSYGAKDVTGAINALVENPDARIISDGTDVLTYVREGKDAGKSVVSAYNIEVLKGVRLLDDGDLWIGVGIAFSHIINNALIQKYIPMFWGAVDMIGGPQIHNTDTIGGNICDEITSASSASTIRTLEADVLLGGLESKHRVPVYESYIGPGRAVRDRTEAYTGFLVRRDSLKGWGSHYIKYDKRKVMEIATLGYAMRVKLSQDKKRIKDVRLGYDVAGPIPLRYRKTEDGLKNRIVNDSEVVLAFSKTALEEVNPRSSWRASKEFRLQLIEELSKRALVEAIKKTGSAISV